MARRSNKTAHVLNLIAGHEVQKEENDDVVSPVAADAPAAPESAATGQTAPPPSTQNISVIDTTEKDPVADLIQQKLSDALNAENPENVDSVSAPVMAAPVQTPVSAQTSAEHPAAGPVKAPDPVQTAAGQTQDPVPAQTAIAQPAATQMPSSDPVQTAAVPQPSIPAPVQTAVAQAAASVQPEAASPTPSPEPEPESEPAFAAVNIMEQIVKDKIIYYMRQFEVCTCDRCVADTIALTLNGLMPKYIVTTPAAVDPLVSYYTNRLISDVTVEATKACMIVKDNPRH